MRLTAVRCSACQRRSPAAPRRLLATLTPSTSTQHRSPHPSPASLVPEVTRSRVLFRSGLRSSSAFHSSRSIAAEASAAAQPVTAPTHTPTSSTSSPSSSNPPTQAMSPSAPDTPSAPPSTPSSSSPSPSPLPVTAPFHPPPPAASPPSPPLHLLRIPNLDLGSAKLSSWLLSPHQSFDAGQPLAELDSDLAVIDYKAQQGGWLAVQTVKEGDEVRVDQVIAVVCDREDEVEGAKREWASRVKRQEREREKRGEPVPHGLTEDIAGLKE